MSVSTSDTPAAVTVPIEEGAPSELQRAPVPPSPAGGDGALPRACSTGTALHSALRQYLTHLADYRDCSPRTVKAYEQDALLLIRFLEEEGVACVEQVLPQHVHRYAGQLAHLAPASIRRRAYALRGWFRYLLDLGIITRNPVAGLELPKRRVVFPKVPSLEQCGALLAACRNDRERLILTLMLMAGLRRAEVLGLNVGDLSAGYEQVRVMGKGRRERVVPLCRAAQATVKACLQDRQPHAGPLVTGREGGRLCTNGFYRLFRRLLARAGLEGLGLTPHSLRHAFATQLVLAGVDVATVSHLLGHSNISTTSICLHSDTTTKNAAVEKLPWATQQETGQLEELDLSTAAPEASTGQALSME